MFNIIKFILWFFISLGIFAEVSKCENYLLEILDDTIRPKHDELYSLYGRIKKQSNRTKLFQSKMIGKKYSSLPKEKTNSYHTTNYKDISQFAPKRAADVWINSLIDPYDEFLFFIERGFTPLEAYDEYLTKLNQQVFRFNKNGHGGYDANTVLKALKAIQTINLNRTISNLIDGNNSMYISYVSGSLVNGRANLSTSSLDLFMDSMYDLITYKDTIAQEIQRAFPGEGVSLWTTFNKISKDDAIELSSVSRIQAKIEHNKISLIIYPRRNSKRKLVGKPIEFVIDKTPEEEIEKLIQKGLIFPKFEEILKTKVYHEYEFKSLVQQIKKSELNIYDKAKELDSLFLSAAKNDQFDQQWFYKSFLDDYLIFKFGTDIPLKTLHLGKNLPSIFNVYLSKTFIHKLFNFLDSNLIIYHYFFSSLERATEKEFNKFGADFVIEKFVKASGFDFPNNLSYLVYRMYYNSSFKNSSGLKIAIRKYGHEQFSNVLIALGINEKTIHEIIY